MKFAVYISSIFVFAQTAAVAQTATQPLSVTATVADASTTIFVDYDSTAPTFTFDTTGVDIIEGGVTESFKLCSTGTTTGGYKLALSNYNSGFGGVGMTAGGTAEIIARIYVASSPSGTPNVNLTAAESAQNFTYGTSCASSDTFNYNSEIRLDESSGRTSITDGTYTATLNLQVIPQ